MAHPPCQPIEHRHHRSHLDLASASNALLVPERVNVTGFVEEVAPELAAEVDGKHLTVTTQSSGVWALGSAILLRQAISDLLRNAIRHHTGGEITVLAWMSPTSTRLTVADTGVGIPQETLDSNPGGGLVAHLDLPAPA